MISVTTTRAEDLPPWAAEQMSLLTKPGSDNSRWLKGISSESHASDMPHDLTFSFATRDENYEMTVIGWCSLACWNGQPALQGFVTPSERSRGLATALTCCLILSQPIPKEKVAVFSREFVDIASRLGFKQVTQYKRVDDGWIAVRPGDA